MQHAYFWQDNAAAHTSKLSVEALHDIFGERIIRQALWPPYSPDFSACVFYVWGNVNLNFYRN